MASASPRTLPSGHHTQGAPRAAAAKRKRQAMDNDNGDAAKRVANVLNIAAQANFKSLLVLGIDHAGELVALNAGLMPVQIVFMLEQFKMQLIMGAPSSPLPPPPAHSS